jgi:hypothetical protein
MKRRWVLVSVLAVLGTMVAIVWVDRSGPTVRPSRVEKLFGGKGLAVVTHPDRIEAFRLDPIDGPTDISPVNFPVKIGPVEVPGELSSALTSAFASERSYDWDNPVGCMPRFAVRLSFYRGQDRVDVLLCMNCCILLVEHDGVETGMGQFDPIRAVIADAVKSLFPGDPVIQSLSRAGGKFVRGL